MPELCRFYGIEKMKMINTVKSVTYVREYTVRVVFGDGYAAEVDLQGLFADRPGPFVRELRDTGRFSEVCVQNGALTFANGYDICSDVLRFYCERGGVASQAETDAFFAGVLADANNLPVGRVAETKTDYGMDGQNANEG